MKAMMMVVVVGMVATLGGMVLPVSGQVFRFGPCPNVTVVPDFDVEKYVGTWYEVEKYFYSMVMGRCVSLTYILMADGKINIDNTETLMGGYVNRGVGQAWTEQSGHLAMKYFWYLPAMQYTVMSTDYRTYSLAYSCSSLLGVTHLENVWVHSRGRFLEPDTHAKIVDTMRRNGIDPSDLIATSQTGCQ